MLKKSVNIIRTILATATLVTVFSTASWAAPDDKQEPLRLPSESIPAEFFERSVEDNDTENTLPAPVAPKFESGSPASRTAAYTAYQLGAYLTALHEATRQVEEDKDAASMALIGVIHLNGAGVPVDEKKAAEWFTLASDRGYAPAMVELGLLKLEGRGTQKDNKGAADLFEKASEKNDPAAHYNMGLLFIAGEERPQDFNKAAEHFRRAAEDGNADAQYAYSLLLKEGRGAILNETLAMQWMEKSAIQGNVEAQLDYAIALFNGRGVDANPAEAAKWLMRASESGNGAAQIRLARLYASGIGLEKDEIRAGAWYLTAIEKGAKNEWMATFWEKLSAEEKAAAENLARSFKGETTLRSSQHSE